MTKSEREHYAKLFDFGCVACYMLGHSGVPCQIHHKRAGQGRKRAGYMDAIGLCPDHHVGHRHPEIASIHLDKNNFIEQFGTEQELIDYVLSKI